MLPKSDKNPARTYSTPYRLGTGSVTGAPGPQLPPPRPPIAPVLTAGQLRRAFVEAAEETHPVPELPQIPEALWDRFLQNLRDR